MGKSSKTIVVAVRLPLALYARLTTLTHETGTRKTDVILRALTLYLDSIKTVLGVNET